LNCSGDEKRYKTHNSTSDFLYFENKNYSYKVYINTYYNYSYEKNKKIFFVHKSIGYACSIRFICKRRRTLSASGRIPERNEKYGI
jgi:hypothetical protein